MRAIVTITLILLILPTLASLAAAQSDPDENSTAEGSEPTDAPESPEAGSHDEGASKADAPGVHGGAEAEGAGGDVEHIEEDEEGIRFNAVSPGGPTYEFNSTRASLEAIRPNASTARAQIDALIEYVDEDGNGAYDLGERVERRFILRDLPVNTSTPEVGMRDATYSLDGNATLTLRLRVASDEKAKYDIIIQNYSSAPDTRLAVSATLDFSVPSRVTIIDGQPAVIGQAGDEVPFLSWVTKVATAEGDATVNWSVHTSTTVAGTDAIIFWSYPASRYILHDPTLGFVQRARELVGSIVPFGVGFAAAVGILGVGLLVRRRSA